MNFVVFNTATETLACLARRHGGTTAAWRAQHVSSAIDHRAFLATDGHTGIVDFGWQQAFCLLPGGQKSTH
jgi:hypothetical protein